MAIEEADVGSPHRFGDQPIRLLITVAEIADLAVGLVAEAAALKTEPPLAPKRSPGVPW